MQKKCISIFKLKNCENILLLAEVPGADKVNLQPAEYLLFCEQFSKMCSSAFRVSGSDGGGGRGQTCTKTLFGTGRDVWKRLVQVFGFPLALHIPTGTDRQKNICMPIFIYIEDKGWVFTLQDYNFISPLTFPIIKWTTNDLGWLNQA